VIRRESSRFHFFHNQLDRRSYMQFATNVGKSERQYKRKKRSLLTRIRLHQFYFLLMIPGFLYYFVFHYIPMLGIIIAFKDLSPFDGLEGILNSPWVGFKHFQHFFDSFYFWNVLSNTVIISLYKLVFSFPAPIVLALLINEVKHTMFKRFVQTVSYLPHFISAVVLSGLVIMVLNSERGVLNELIVFFGGDKHNFLGTPDGFRTILVSTEIWHSAGWGTILYLAAMTGIDPQLYEAAKMDGANKWQQIRHITLPGITFVIVLLLILNIGKFMDAGFELILLLYSPAVYKVGDIIDTYVYREGLIQLQYSFTAAVGLFKNIIGMLLILGMNYLAKKFNQTGIW
jgi:putative aldouronate transport system permease protein